MLIWRSGQHGGLDAACTAQPRFKSQRRWHLFQVNNVAPIEVARSLARVRLPTPINMATASNGDPPKMEKEGPSLIVKCTDF